MARRAKVRASTLAQTAMPVPTGMDWTPPIAVYQNGSTFTTSFDAAHWMVPATASLWCSPTGSDATGDGTQGNPFRSIKKCFTQAETLPDQAVTIYVVTGEYQFNNHFSNTSCDRDLNIIAVGGRALCTNKLAVASWTLDGAGTYKATRSGIVWVRDSAFTDATYPSIPSSLTLAASVAACQATPGTWFTDNVTVWVHRQDGSIPDATASGPVGLIFGTPAGLFTKDRNWFIQGIDFEGSTAGLMRAVGIPTATKARLVMDNCTGRFSVSTTSDSFILNGFNLTILNNVKIFRGAADLVNYNIGDTNNVSTKFVEIGCEFREGGTSTGDHYNATTSHSNCRGLRVNGLYSNTWGPVVADITTSQTWNIKCSATDSNMITNTSQDACFQRGDLATGTTWLDNCTASGSFYATYADAAGAAIRTRDCTLTGGTSGDVAAY